MARAGDRLTVEGQGVSILMLATSEETAGELVRYEVSFRARGVITQAHVHPHQEERHELVSGRLGLDVDGAFQTLTEGQVVAVPAGAPHALVRIDDGEVRLVLEMRPALRQEALIETAARLSRQGFRTWRGYPNPLLLAVYAREFEREVQAARPPLAVQRALIRPLAAIGRALGYHTR